MNDTIKTLEKSIRAYDPTINFSSSSALTDLLINPLASIIAPYQRQLDTLVKEQTMLNPDTMSEATMDKYASNFGITRTTGAKATGYVKIYFRSPRTLYVEPGTYFETADGKRFNTTAAYSITESQMATNIADYPNVSTGLIPVVAVNYGVSNETGPNTVTKVVGLSVSYAYVKNPVAITGGTDRETNTALKARILDSVINKSISSVNGIKAAILTNFTSVNSVTVKGFGDDEMTRDLVYSTISGELLSNLPAYFYRSDYFGALSGIQTPPANTSRGYWGVFHVEVPAGSGLVPGDLPSEEVFTDEWTTGQYTGVYKVDDALSQEISTDYILKESFINIEAPDNDDWVKSDGSTSDNELIAVNEIATGSGRLRLGKTDAISKKVLISPEDKLRLIDILDLLSEKPQKSKGLER